MDDLLYLFGFKPDVSNFFLTFLEWIYVLRYCSLVQRDYLPPHFCEWLTVFLAQWPARSEMARGVSLPMAYNKHPLPPTICASSSSSSLFFFFFLFPIPHSPQLVESSTSLPSSPSPPPPLLLLPFTSHPTLHSHPSYTYTHY